MKKIDPWSPCRHDRCNAFFVVDSILNLLLSVFRRVGWKRKYRQVISSNTFPSVCLTAYVFRMKYQNLKDIWHDNYENLIFVVEIIICLLFYVVSNTGYLLKCYQTDTPV